MRWPAAIRIASPVMLPGNDSSERIVSGAITIDRREAAATNQPRAEIGAAAQPPIAALGWQNANRIGRGDRCQFVRTQPRPKPGAVHFGLGTPPSCCRAIRSTDPLDFTRAPRAAPVLVLLALACPGLYSAAASRLVTARETLATRTPWWAGAPAHAKQPGYEKNASPIGAIVSNGPLVPPYYY